MSTIDWVPFWISFKLASITTAILFMIALPLAWWLSTTRCRCKPAFEAVVSLPIVLPPSVLGFYLLWALSQDSMLGRFFENYFDVRLVFSFTGLVIASCIYSFPFMVQPLQSGFESLNKNMIEASYVAGKSRLQTLMHVAIPNIKPSLLLAVVVTFAHTIGEFGVVLMVGGSIPSQTKVASVAIYEYVEMLDYKSAHIYSFIMLSVSFTVLLLLYIFSGKKSKTAGLG